MKDVGLENPTGRAEHRRPSEGSLFKFPETCTTREPRLSGTYSEWSREVREKRRHRWTILTGKGNDR